MTIVLRSWTYSVGGEVFEGQVSWNARTIGTRPGVMVAHAFGGQGPFEAEKAIALATLGYVGFAIDLYGRGRRATSAEEARTLMNELDEDRNLLRQRMEGSLAALKSLEQVDALMTAAVGYCFGGKCVLDLARAGADTRAVVSFHGLLDAPKEEQETPVRASILALHGWDDPLAQPADVRGFAEEFSRRKADWQVQLFGGVGHSFTNPRAQSPEQRLVYDPLADQRSWAAMTRFLAERFDRPPMSGPLP